MAVATQSDQIAEAVTIAETTLRAGGRLLYVGGRDLRAARRARRERVTPNIWDRPRDGAGHYCQWHPRTHPVSGRGRRQSRGQRSRPMDELA